MKTDFEKYLIEARSDFCDLVKENLEFPKDKKMLTAIDSFLIAYDNICKDWKRLYIENIDVHAEIVSVANSKK